MKKLKYFLVSITVLALVITPMLTLTRTAQAATNSTVSVWFKGSNAVVFKIHFAATDTISASETATLEESDGYYRKMIQLVNISGVTTDVTGDSDFSISITDGTTVSRYSDTSASISASSDYTGVPESTSAAGNTYGGTFVAKDMTFTLLNADALNGDALTFYVYCRILD